ncbi:MAG: DUF2341 domain-containing protein [Planctomycetota bacterium]|jgi:biopolymer transport protein ExbB
MAFPTGYSYKQKLTLDTSATGANIPSTLSNYSILVRLTSSNFDFSHARADGYDVRFYDSVGTELSFERERYDNGSELAEFWIRIPSLIGNDSTQYIWMYYGNAGAGDVSSGPNTFRTADGYVAVYHCGEASGTFYDSTSNGYDLTDATSATDKDGQIAKGQEFDGTDDYYYRTSFDETNYSEMTVSCWANPDSTSEWVSLLKKEGNDYFNYGWGIRQNSSGNWISIINTGSGGGGGKNENSFGTASIGTWKLVGWAFKASDATELEFYEDGVSQGTADTSPDANCRNDGSDTFYLAYPSNGDDDEYDGHLDEVRIENVRRTDDWMRLRYQNEQDTDTLIDYGSEQSIRVPDLMGFTKAMG